MVGQAKVERVELKGKARAREGKRERVPCLLTTCVVIVGMLAKIVDTIGMHVV